MTDALHLAVVTGGHPYDVPNFHRLFHAIGDGMNVYIQHMDDFASSPAEVRQGYDVVLFYIMLMHGPSDEGNPWYAGKPKTALESLGQTAQGIVLLHHAILAYPQFGLWDDFTGITGRSFGYHIGEMVVARLAEPDHPILDNVRDWSMIDETYTMAEPGIDSRVLITYDHPKSMQAIAWTRQVGQSRVFNYQAGHDNATWNDVNFRQVLRRGILWAGGKI